MKKHQFEKTSKFLSRSIEDLQATIRAMDTKLGLLLVVIIIPIGWIEDLNLIKFWFYLSNPGKNPWGFFVVLLVLLFLVFWIFSFLATFKGITGFSDIDKYIKGWSGKKQSNFYRTRLYETSFLDVIFNRTKTISKNKVKSIYENLPTTDKTILEELIFEQTKLNYIRDLKLKRQHWAFKSSLIWLSVGFLILIIT